ncbi:uncharacterized protein LOC110436890 isoform X3 [Sorghum bicolor]|uniref:uncharacterized protein LOC110436890 isoform X3 n=1 Tax=Sorghum bicolor TaxID=4558 RepID=UPI000B424A20|nr:uncharacterized protein LOC110436890 isoform X3 [Sorghum bicolor]|eukprot:XP_021320227.1 uncharacterized protein LOC110436890 isoform X3 [Sorghum bicolor]
MRQPPDLALIQAVKVRPRKRDEKNTALPSSRPMTRLLAPTSRPIVKKLQKRGYKSYLAIKFPKSCIHIGQPTVLPWVKPWTAKTPSLPVNSNNGARSGSITYLKVIA